VHDPAPKLTFMQKLKIIATSLKMPVAKHFAYFQISRTIYKSSNITQRKTMHPVIAKTFGGLSSQYYFRQFVFGMLFPIFLYLIMSRGPHGVPITMYVFCAVNTLLYPYSRFVYESIINFIMGNNTFFVNAFLMLFMKSMTMALCWSCAIFIAPVGLAYLYYHHSKASQ